MKFDIKKECSLLEFVLENFPNVSTTKAKKMILYNCFTISGASVKSTEYILRKGDMLEYRKYSGGRHIAKEKRDISVLYEDKNILVVNKTFGQKVFDPKDKKNEDMLTMVKRYVHKRERSAAVYIIFSPDVYESGLCIFAKNKYAYQNMTQELDKMICEIDAIVSNKPKHKNDKLSFFFSEDNDRYSLSPNAQEGYKNFSFQYATKEDLSKENENFFLLHIIHSQYRPLLTRFCLKQMGCPVVGDVRFDKQKVNNMLKFHYSSLTFRNIINNKTVTVTSKLPNTFRLFNTPIH
ncbi:MAG: hypothetical protein Q4Q06_02590 [Bacteroidota bacterium]|nr:hypothetical protein [Bacteroidota bacterium]